MGFSTPSRIQEIALPMIIADPPRDLIAQAQAGTGKTAAFTLGLLHRCIKNSFDGPKAIVLSPTRELAIQTHKRISTMARFTKVTIHLAVAEDASDRIQNDKVVDQHVIVGTPGKILALMSKAIDYKQVQVLVVDEADLMVTTQSLGPTTYRIIRALPNAQKLMFSATFNPKLRVGVESVIQNPNKVILHKHELTVADIKEFCIDCGDSDHRVNVLQDIYGHMTKIGQTIIFVNTKAMAIALNSKLEKNGYTVSLIHGDMTMQAREATFLSFCEAQTTVLITTNLLARGIDIKAVSLIINFDMPYDGNGYPDFETYIHRVGRTGRFGRYGVAVNLVHDDQSIDAVKKIEQFYNKPIKTLEQNKIDDFVEEYVNKQPKKSN